MGWLSKRRGARIAIDPLRVVWWVCLLASLCAGAPDARAQVETGVDGSATISGSTAAGESELERFWLGAYYRHQWVPGYVTEPFLKRAPSVTNNGFGLTVQYRSDSALNLVGGIGYMPYSFSGPFLADGQPATDTELVKSDLKFIHLTGSLLWDVEFHHTVALEIGVGLDLGFFLGEVRRNEAYRDEEGVFRNCVGPADPPVMLDDVLYCNDSMVTDDPSEEGEHYDVKQDIPPVLAFPMLPQIALRVQPFEYLTVKAEFAFGLVQLWAGVTLQMSFGIFEKGPTEVFVPPEPDRPAVGRVLGKVVDAESGVPVAGATVRLSARALSPLTTEVDGRFIVDRLDPGKVRFEVEHPDYEKGSCEVEVDERGGDAAVECHLRPRARLGAISGQVEAEDGTPIPNVVIELTGPQLLTLKSDDRGLFAAVDLQAGTYRLRAVADDYLVQLLELVVAPRDTAMPQIILIKKPKRSVVQLRKEEIVITEQIQFKSNSSEIVKGSDNVLRQVADVLLRNPQIELLEVQGHTDNTGTRAHNMQLSQARAEAVRDFLVQAGIETTRLLPKGYGPDEPIRANDTPANRAKNRRVQFIIRKQAE